MRKSSAVTACVSVLLMAACETGAQQGSNPERRGVWTALGYDVARYDMECSGCAPGTSDHAWKTGNGGGMVAGAGVAIRQRFLVGGELGFAGASRNDLKASFLTLLAIGRFYPLAERGLFVSGGAGFASATASRAGGSAEASGTAVQVGAGYDIRIPRSRSLALTPYARYSATFLDSSGLRVHGNMTGVTALDSGWLAQLGLALSWY